MTLLVITLNSDFGYALSSFLTLVISVTLVTRKSSYFGYDFDFGAPSALILPINCL